MLREVKSSQRAPRLLAIQVDGTGTASITVGGTDVTLTDNGTGDYTLTFATAFARVPTVVVTPISATGDLIATIETASATLLDIRLWDGTDGTTAKDGDFHCLIMGYDSADQI
jgi:hypothetical protein